MAKTAKYWCVEHEFHGVLNCVSFTDEERAISYAAKMHTIAEPLYKAGDFIDGDIIEEEIICLIPQETKI